MVEWDDGKKYRQFHLLHHHHHSRGREGRKRKQIEKKWEKEDKTKENSRTRERLTLTISSETPDVLSDFTSPMVASSPIRESPFNSSLCNTFTGNSGLN